MILTVTLNSSIDKLYLMESVHPETVMRVKEVHNTAGGKGLNVSRVAAGWASLSWPWGSPAASTAVIWSRSSPVR